MRRNANTNCSKNIVSMKKEDGALTLLTSNQKPRLKLRVSHGADGIHVAMGLLGIAKNISPLTRRGGW